MPAEAPKRTRRVEVPFDARLEVRMYSTELAALRDAAKGQGVSASDLVRSKLGKLIKAEPPEAPERSEEAEPTETPQAPAPEPPALTDDAESVDLADAIAQVTDNSWGYAALQIRLGKVSVGDEVWTEQRIPVALLPDLKLNGEPLPIEAVEQERADTGDE